MSKSEQCQCCLSVTVIMFHMCSVCHTHYHRRTEYSIFMAGLRVNRNNAKLFNNVGHALEGKNNFTKALRYFKQAAMYVQSNTI